MARDNLIVGLDMGSHKMTAVIGRMTRLEEEIKSVASPYELEIIGVGSVNSQGIRGGVIVNINAALNSVQAALEKAEFDASIDAVEEMMVSFAGGGVEGLNSRGVVAVSGKQGKREISAEDMDRVTDAARAILIPMDREVLHVIPREYVVDDVGGIRNPLEMIGIRLEAEVHIITGSVSATQNLIQSVNRAGYFVQQIVLEALADSYSVLSQEEKEVGVLLIDFGSGTTDVIFYLDGAPLYTKVFSLGSERVTKDIAQVLQIPEPVAEEIKLSDGVCFLPVLKADSEVIIKGVGSRPASVILKSELCEIIQPRMEEILGLILQDLQELGLVGKLGAGVVLTGGGALLEGFPELSEAVFRTPARTGTPMRISGLEEAHIHPSYTTALGLVKMAAMDYKGGSEKITKEKGDGIWSRLKNYFKKNWL